MVLVDTSAWIEWLIGSPTGDKLTEYLPDQADWLVPTMVQLELMKWLTREVGEDKADQVEQLPHVVLGLLELGDLVVGRVEQDVERVGDQRARVEVDQWLFWQMGGLGPMCGQAHHFRQYAPEKVPYAIERYTNEVNRLYGVMNRRLADRDFLAGDYSVADMACIGWIKPHENQGQDLSDFPNLKRWFETMLARPAVDKGLVVGQEYRRNLADDKEAQKVLFGQKAR